MNELIFAAVLIAAQGGLGSGRLIPTVAAAVGLIGVALGGMALARVAGRTGGVIAVAAGLISALVGGLHSANSGGGFGTGNGLAGAIVAIVLGLISMALGGLAMARSSAADPTLDERRPGAIRRGE